MHIEVSCPDCRKPFGVNVPPDDVAAQLLRTRTMRCEPCWRRASGHPPDPHATAAALLAAIPPGAGAVMAQPRTKHPCPTCHGLGYVRLGWKRPAPRQYCSETLDHENCTAFDMEHETCRLGHALRFRVPANMREVDAVDDGWFRVGYLHRKCPDFELLQD